MHQTDHHKGGILFMRPEYETNRLLLSTSHPDKADSVLRFYERNREFLEPYEPVKRPGFYTLDFQRTNLTFEYNSFVKARYLRMWMYLKETPDIPIGTVCFSNFLKGAFSSCMIGYKTDKDHLRQGYMTEALSFLVPLVCREYHFHRIEAYVMPDNPASISLLENLTFHREGLLHDLAQINGKWEDHYISTYLA